MWAAARGRAAGSGPAPIGRRLAFLIAVSFVPVPSDAAIFDRIAAIVDRQVITLSEIDQMVTIRFFPRSPSTAPDDHRREVLDNLIAQALRFRDVERFGAQDIPRDSIESRVREIAGRFESPADLDAALARAELSQDELRALVKRQLQVESYIQERFAPLVFVSNEEIETYYRGTWAAQRRARGLAVPPLAEVREEIRALLRASRLRDEIDKWTTQLRARANVDIHAWR